MGRHITDIEPAHTIKSLKVGTRHTHDEVLTNMCAGLLDIPFLLQPVSHDAEDLYPDAVPSSVHY